MQLCLFVQLCCPTTSTPSAVHEVGAHRTTPPSPFPHSSKLAISSPSSTETCSSHKPTTDENCQMNVNGSCVCADRACEAAGCTSGGRGRGAGCANVTLQSLIKNHYAPNTKAALIHQKCYPESPVFPAEIPPDGLQNDWTTGDEQKGMYGHTREESLQFLKIYLSMFKI